MSPVATPIPKRGFAEIKWREFAASLDLDKAHPTQREEMRKAFYAGMTMMFARVMMSDDELAADEEAIMAIARELNDFAQGMIDEGAAHAARYAFNKPGRPS